MWTFISVHTALVDIPKRQFNIWYDLYFYTVTRGRTPPGLWPGCPLRACDASAKAVSPNTHGERVPRLITWIELGPGIEPTADGTQVFER